MTSSSKLEREVEASRAQVEDTVDALRDKLSVGDIVNEATRYLKESGGSDVAARLGQQVRDNPLPLLLVGVGLAWLMSGRGQPHLKDGRDVRPEDDRFGQDIERHPSCPVSARGSEAYDGGRASDDPSASGGSQAGSESITNKVGEAVSDAASSVSGAVGSATDWAKRRSQEVSRRGRDAYARAGSWSEEAYDQGRGYARSSYRRAERTFTDTLEREPLILGAIGVAVGAAVGAMLPRTNVEDRYLGSVSARVKEEAEEIARDQMDRGAEVVKTAAKAGTKKAGEMESAGTVSDTTSKMSDHPKPSSG